MTEYIIRLYAAKQFTHNLNKMTETTTHQALEPIEVEPLNNLDNSLLNSSGSEVNSLVAKDKQFSPLSRREFAEQNGVSPAYVGQLVKRLAKVWQPIDPDFIVLTTDDKITSNAQQELLAMIASKPAKYQKRVWAESGYDPKAKPENVESPEVSVPSGSSALTVVPQENQFGLTVQTKASDRLALVQAEIVESESACESDLEDFLALSTEIEYEEQAATELDDAEFALLRKKNAQKWLKRRAILERDKQQILQGDLPQLKRGEGS